MVDGGEEVLKRRYREERGNRWRNGDRGVTDEGRGGEGNRWRKERERLTDNKHVRQLGERGERKTISSC